MRRNLGFERHWVDCGASFGKGQGKAWLLGTIQAAGLAGCFKWFSSDFEGLHLSIQCERIRALSAFGRTVARHLGRAGGKPGFWGRYKRRALRDVKNK